MNRPSHSAATLGINSVRSALKFGCEGVVALWLDQTRRDRRLAELAALAREAGIAVRQVSRDELDRAAEGGNHQGALAWVKMPAALTEHDLERLLDQLPDQLPDPPPDELPDRQPNRWPHASGQPPLLLVLDGVTDPHNVGACLRSADGAGATAVIAPKDKAVGLTPVVVKVASGAAESVPFVQVTNLARTLDVLKARGIWLVGLADTAPASLFETDLSGPTALVLGSEGAGLRRLTQARCDLLASLPMRGGVESLNVSVAAGICLYEVLRRRLIARPVNSR